MPSQPVLGRAHCGECDTLLATCYVPVTYSSRARKRYARIVPCRALCDRPYHTLFLKLNPEGSICSAYGATRSKISVSSLRDNLYYVPPVSLRSACCHWALRIFSPSHTTFRLFPSWSPGSIRQDAEEGDISDTTTSVKLASTRKTPAEVGTCRPHATLLGLNRP